MNYRDWIRLVIFNALITMACFTVFNCLFGFTPSRLLVTSGVYGAAFGSLDWYRKRKRGVVTPNLRDRIRPSPSTVARPTSWREVWIIASVMAIGSFLFFTPASLIAAVALNLDSRHALAMAVTWTTVIWVVTAVLFGMRKVRQSP